VRFTALSAGTLVFAAGVVLITLPSGIVALDAKLTVPTTRPAFWMFVVAVACVWPTTFGTILLFGPSDTARATPVPGGSVVPATGDWLMIRPLTTVALNSCVVVPTTSPA